MAITDRFDSDEEAELKIYGGYAAACIRTDSGYNTYSVPIGVYAHSKHEALGKALTLCRQNFSVENGYYDHTADVVEIPTPNKMDALLASEVTDSSKDEWKGASEWWLPINSK